MPAIKVSEVLKPYGVVGIFVNGCVERGEGSSFRAEAHSHCFPERPYYRWICVRSSKRLYLNGSDHPSTLLWHETAHIWRRSWNEEQCDTWARNKKEVEK